MSVVLVNTDFRLVSTISKQACCCWYRTGNGMFCVVACTHYDVQWLWSVGWAFLWVLDCIRSSERRALAHSRHAVTPTHCQVASAVLTECLYAQPTSLCMTRSCHTIAAMVQLRQLYAGGQPDLKLKLAAGDSCDKLLLMSSGGTRYYRMLLYQVACSPTLSHADYGCLAWCPKALGRMCARGVLCMQTLWQLLRLQPSGVATHPCNWTLRAVGGAVQCSWTGLVAASAGGHPRVRVS